jgi:outer membrane protein OmpA-like peptidoglycan-associated protein
MFANVADILKDFIIEVEGNCATIYTDIDDNKDNVISYNLSLSRAKAALNYLQEKGIDPNRIVIIGNGSDKPIKANTTEEERQYNRRVEISFKLKEK